MTREDVLREFMPCGGEICKGCEVTCTHVDGRDPDPNAMADEIARLRGAQGRITLLDYWYVIDTEGDDVYGAFATYADARFCADGTAYRVVRAAIDAAMREGASDA